MENIINNNKKKINLVGDKGYIKQIKDKHNITLITPLRVNSKKKNLRFFLMFFSLLKKL